MIFAATKIFRAYQSPTNTTEEITKARTIIKQQIIQERDLKTEMNKDEREQGRLVFSLCFCFYHW